MSVITHWRINFEQICQLLCPVTVPSQKTLLYFKMSHFRSDILQFVILGCKNDHWALWKTYIATFHIVAMCKGNLDMKIQLSTNSNLNHWRNAFGAIGNYSNSHTLFVFAMVCQHHSVWFHRVKSQEAPTKRMKK